VILGPRSALHAKQHAAAAANLHGTSFGHEDDFTLGVAPPRMADRQVRKTVGTARIGGENPEGLRPVISFDRTVAFGAFLGGRLREDSILNGPAHDAIAVRDLATFSVHNFATDLGRGQPVVNVALAWAHAWNLGEFDLERGSQCSEVSEHGNALFAAQDRVKFDGEGSFFVRGRGTHVGHATKDLTASPKLRSAPEWNVLHKPGFDHVSLLVSLRR
jgi:hypothetical protein